MSDPIIHNITSLRFTHLYCYLVYYILYDILPLSLSNTLAIVNSNLTFGNEMLQKELKKRRQSKQIVWKYEKERRIEDNHVSIKVGFHC